MSGGEFFMRKWVKPLIYEENLAANQNVAVSACLVGKIQCQYPGNGSTNGQKNLMIIMANNQDGIQIVKAKNMVFMVMMQIFHLLVQQVQVMKKIME